MGKFSVPPNGKSLNRLDGGSPPLGTTSTLGAMWNRFLLMVDQVLPRRGGTLPLPFDAPPENKAAAN